MRACPIISARTRNACACVTPACPLFYTTGGPPRLATALAARGDGCLPRRRRRRLRLRGGEQQNAPELRSERRRAPLARYRHCDPADASRGEGLVRLQIIRNARIENVGESESCMVSK